MPEEREEARPLRREPVRWNDAGAVELLVAIAASEQLPAPEPDVEEPDFSDEPLETLPVVSYLDAIDDTSSTIYMSRRVENLLGYSPDDWTADPNLWIETIHPEDRERVLALHARSNETGEPFAEEYRLVGRDGRVVWVRDEAVLVRDENGKPCFWEGVIIDISARKRAEH